MERTRAGEPGMLGHEKGSENPKKLQQHLRKTAEQGRARAGEKDAEKRLCPSRIKDEEAKLSTAAKRGGCSRGSDPRINSPSSPRSR